MAKAPRAYENLEFLNSPAARAIRVECEMIEPAFRLYPYGIHKTLVVFGSARTPSKEDAETALEALKKRLKEQPFSEDEKEEMLKRARQDVRNSVYYEAARQLSYDLTKWTMEAFPQASDRFYICSGGGPGIMEAANRGAFEAGGKTLGLGIMLPYEQKLNPYISPTLSFDFRYFFVRKYWFLKLARALIAFPGGFGTMDELFEMLTLVQTGKSGRKIPIILYGREFWESIIDFEKFYELGYISKEDLSDFIIVDSVDEAREIIIREITEGGPLEGGPKPVGGL